MESVWGEEELEGDRGNIPRFSLCWFMAVGREGGELRIGESLAICVGFEEKWDLRSVKEHSF